MLNRRIFSAAEIDLSVGALVLGWLILYYPTYERLANTVWRTDEQGHGPIICALAVYLIWRQKPALSCIQNNAVVSGGSILCVGLSVFVLGHSLSVAILEVGSQIIVLCALFLIFKGWAGLRLVAFPIVFLAFMVPLPAAFVGAVTAPLKIAVSTVAASVLYQIGYPVGQSGVTITIGQYELLVADACAGLNSMFTLEALGFLYMNILGHSSRLRNFALAATVIPIAFVANVIRVIALILVTYYWGDGVGQGFVHGFAGMLLFIVALTMIFMADLLIGKVISKPNARTSVGVRRNAST